MISFFNRLFRPRIQPETHSPNPETDPSNLDDTQADSEISPSTSEEPSFEGESIHLDIPQLIVGVSQSVGIERDQNEDAFYAFTANLLSGVRSLNFGLYMIADGMGGHENGEVASNLAVEKLSSYVNDHLYQPILTSREAGMDGSIHEVIQSGVALAHQAIKEQAVGGGTTLTAALILGDQLTISHIGDSRAYLFDPQENLSLLTHDHSLVKRLEEIGQLSPEQASIHPNRNVLYRALGQGDLFESDIASYQVEPGSAVLLCSDGLWGEVPEAEMTRVLRTYSQPQLACQALVDLANAAGGPDNISVIIIRFSE